MYFPRKFITEIKNLSCFSRQILKFGKNMEFTLNPKPLFGNSVLFHLENQKGDFEINKITAKWNVVNREEIFYEKFQKRFDFHDNGLYPIDLEFEIFSKVEYKKQNSVFNSHQLKFPSERLKMLDLYEYDEIKLVMPNYNYLIFNCYFKKHEEGVIEVHIVNPYNLKINGKYFVKKYML